MSKDKLELFLGEAYQFRPPFEIFKYLNKRKKTLFIDDREIMIWYPHVNRNWFGLICKELLCQ